MKKAKTKAKKAGKPTRVRRPSPTRKSKPKPARVEAADKSKSPRPEPPPTVSEPEPRKIKLTKEESAKFQRLLLELRDHLIDGVNFLASDNLKRSSRDASGELSGYSLHMADAGTDNFDREFALSLVSNEQDALYEIEEALKRLEQGTYGVCEMCEKPIRKERLEAVPFARLCVQCQASVEKDRRRPTQTTAVFSETAEEEGDEREDTED